MLDQLVEDSIRQLVKSFVANGTLFTALDVSNEVKQINPQARHREVRDVVRAMFATDVEPQGWARSDISVTLEDGSTATALLYHPLSSSWDLDSLYDAQKRAQKSVKAVSVAPKTTAVSVDGNGNISVKSDNPITISAPTVQATVPAATRDLWKQMFQSQPSLFPRK